MIHRKNVSDRRPLGNAECKSTERFATALCFHIMGAICSLRRMGSIISFILVHGQVVQDDGSEPPTKSMALQRRFIAASFLFVAVRNRGSMRSLRRDLHVFGSTQRILY